MLSSPVRVDDGVVTWRTNGATVGTWTGRLWGRDVSRRGDANGTTGGCLGLTILSSIILAVLLMIGGTGQSTGPVVELESTVQFLCTRRRAVGYLPSQT